MGHQPFSVAFRLATPVIGEGLSLPGLLASAIYERTGDTERAHSEIPLRKIGDVWVGSNLFYQGPATRASVSFTRSTRPGDALTEDMIAPTRGAKIARVHVARGPTKSLLNYYEAISTPLGIAFGFGDVAKITDLLGDIVGIGKKRNVGYGEIVAEDIGFGTRCMHVDIATPKMKQGLNIEDYGLLTPDGAPARAMPFFMWETIQAETSVFNGHVRREMASIKLPRWRGERELCVVPTNHILSRDGLVNLFNGGE